MVTQNPILQARKLQLRWFVTLSTLPLLGVLSAFGIIPQSNISFEFGQKFSEEISLPFLDQQIENTEVFWRTVKTQRGDTIDELLRRLDVNDTAASEYLRNTKDALSLQQLSSGKDVQTETNKKGNLISLRFTDNNGNQIFIEKKGDHYITHKSSKQIEKRIFMRTGEIESTLFAATDAAGLNDIVANQLADIFSGDIDFHRDLRRGDTFSLIYEMNYVNGEPLNNGNILAAEFHNQGQKYRALYYEITTGNGSYFSQDGKNMRKAFLRSPLEFTRVSSGFQQSRFHPILKEWRAHKGVDYAASTGTKVKATADGVVAFAGKQGGYGNMVTISHQGRYSTLYGHLSRFSNGLHVGQRISQGEIIAFVGQTGLATGPHLHYEFKINGQQRDPLRVPLPDAKPINAIQKSQFQTATLEMVERLNVLSGYRLARLN